MPVFPAINGKAVSGYKLTTSYRKIGGAIKNLRAMSIEKASLYVSDDIAIVANAGGHGVCCNELKIVTSSRKNSLFIDQPVSPVNYYRITKIDLNFREQDDPVLR
jgi:hypothetical protein